MDRKQELRARIKLLEGYKLVEEKASDRSQIYIDDLNLTLTACRNQLNWIKRNPGQYEMVNGV